MCRLKFLKVLIFGEIKKLKKIKKIKTNEVCQQKYSPFSKIICNDNATIVFISFIFFISFNFPKKNVMKKIVILLFLLLVTCTLIGCATSKQATQVVESSLHDTVYLNKVVYDSIYIDNWYHTYLKADTVVVEKTKYEYRYKVLRDTVYKARIDTVPVIREVEVVREVRHLPWYAKALSVLGALFLILILFKILLYFK